MAAAAASSSSCRAVPGGGEAVREAKQGWVSSTFSHAVDPRAPYIRTFVPPPLRSGVFVFFDFVYPPPCCSSDDTHPTPTPTTVDRLLRTRLRFRVCVCVCARLSKSLSRVLAGVTVVAFVRCGGVFESFPSTELFFQFGSGFDFRIRKTIIGNTRRLD